MTGSPRRPRAAGTRPAGLRATVLTTALLTLLTTALTTALTVLVPSAAHAADGTMLVVSGAAVPAGQSTALVVTLTGPAGPVPGAAVGVERRTAGAWAAVATVTTDGSGRAQLPVVLAPTAADNVFRATWAGDATTPPLVSAETVVGLVRLGSRLALDGPATVVDEQEATLEVTWTAADGRPVAGPVVLTQRDGRRWRVVERLRTGDDGRARTRVAPRDDAAYRLEVPDLDAVTGATSRALRLRVLPSGVPVRLPAASPRPRVRLPAQPHATTPGADPVVTAVPDAVWRDMVGRSWRPGCPVGRSGLRLVRVNYWDFDGFRRRGELVAAVGAAAQMAGALADMYDARLPVRAMYRVDRFGYSGRVRGGDDFRSMAADNTSAFNCRQVVNAPGLRSPHASGRSLDVNPWENPYRSRTGLVPNGWWQGHADARVAWRSRTHQVVRIMARHGLRWTYGLGDTQHFDAR